MFPYCSFMRAVTSAATHLLSEGAATIWRTISSEDSNPKSSATRDGLTPPSAA